MTQHEPDERDDFGRLLTAARGGSAEALGRLLMRCRDYLLLVAHRNLDADLKGKCSPSDLVQEAFLEAQRDFPAFHGAREDELLAWLGRILLNNLANVSRSFRGTAKRALDREVPLRGGSGAGRPAHEPALDTPSPSENLAAREEAAALQAALATMPDNYRSALRLRYDEQMTFAEIGSALGCSAEAARKLWARAVDRLQKELARPHASG